MYAETFDPVYLNNIVDCLEFERLSDNVISHQIPLFSES